VKKRSHAQARSRNYRSSALPRRQLLASGAMVVCGDRELLRLRDQTCPNTLFAPLSRAEQGFSAPDSAGDLGVGS
jgi:hypothetical protein